MKDHYKTLGIASTASEKEIKSAYRALAVKYHPDKNNGSKVAEEKFKEINEAYETLGDDTKRKAYDWDRRQKKAAVHGGFASTKPNNSSTNYSDPPPPQRPKGKDIFSKITITEDEAKKGTKKIVKLLKKEKCVVCRGRAASFLGCSSCGGSGFIVKSFKTSNGDHKIKNQCPMCTNGQRAVAICLACQGIGSRVSESSVDVFVPADFKASSIRVMGKGLPYDGFMSGDPGDLIVYVTIKKA